jgi:two-component system sensor histidine kinase SenX3
VESTTVAVLAAALGVLVGSLGVLGFRLSERQQQRLPDLPEPELPPGVADVLAVLSSAAIVLDDDDRVVRASPASYALGIARGHRVVHDELVAMVREVRRSGEIHEAELELPRGPLGAGRVVVGARVAPLRPRHVLLLVTDRTDARRVEEVRRDFVENVSHELKTPVGAISLLAEAISGAAEDADAVRRFADRMSLESQRLSLLVQEIIDLSRLQVAGALGEAVLVGVKEVVTEAVDRCRLTAEDRSVTVDLGRVPDARVYGDAELLTTAVRNLVDNAIRYSEPGSRVVVDVQRAPGLVDITVTDQGIGIAPEEVERVFERFYRADPARSRATGGTGLGLTIVNHVAANPGGDVEVQSTPGAGSRFTLRLPEATPNPVIM